MQTAVNKRNREARSASASPRSASDMSPTAARPAPKRARAVHSDPEGAAQGDALLTAVISFMRQGAPEDHPILGSVLPVREHLNIFWRSTEDIIRASSDHAAEEGAARRNRSQAAASTPGSPSVPDSLRPKMATVAELPHSIEKLAMHDRNATSFGLQYRYGDVLPGTAVPSQGCMLALGPTQLKRASSRKHVQGLGPSSMPSPQNRIFASEQGHSHGSSVIILAARSYVILR